MRDEARQLLYDLMTWHMNQMDAAREIRALKERVVLLTGRTDLAEADSHDLTLRAHLIDAVEDYLD